MHIIRSERPEDVSAIRAVLTDAFSSGAEAALVEALRKSGRLSISLVALEGDEIVGHIAFSPVTVAGVSGGLGLAPVAVKTARQSEGIGSDLIREGLSPAAGSAAPFVVVLGEPAYYGRFGFTPASSFGLTGEHGGGDAFQVLELVDGVLPRGAGLVRYAPEFRLVA